MQMSYSFHISNDGNKSIKSRQQAKNTPSRTTSKNNSAIQNAKQLGKVNHHNLRMYDNKKELIKTIKGSDDINKDVKELYLDLFEGARIEYNNKQTRDDRKIKNYFNKISNDDKHDLACEIIIELGDMSYWDDKSLQEKYIMTDVFEQQLDDLKEIVPEFYVANATIHFDEHSPHMHIVGVPVKEDCKTGLSRQVGKTAIFTKESLERIQDKMRERCIEEFNIAYGLDFKLKEKQKGQNKDITPYERKLYNEKIKGLNDDILILREEVDNLSTNKESISKEINELSQTKKEINDEIDKKADLSKKIILKPKNKMQEEIDKLKEENSNLKDENKEYKTKYEELKEKTDYLIFHLNKIIKQLPEFIQKIVDILFNNNVRSLFSFKHEYDPDELKERKKGTKKQSRFITSFKYNKQDEINAIESINQQIEDEAERERLKRIYKEDASNKDKDFTL